MGFLRGTKADIVLLLAKAPAHGYAVARKLKLTLSTVYEHLKELEAAGLVAPEQDGRRRIVRLTARGRALANLLGEHPSDSGRREGRGRPP